MLGVVLLLYQSKPSDVPVAPSPSPTARTQLDSETPKPVSSPKALPAQTASDESKVKPLPLMPPPPPPPDVVPESEGQGTVTAADLNYLAERHLLIPVSGVTANQLRDNFNEGRSEGRPHLAIDIMAAAGTPVMATTDGIVTKLFQSERGGITLYELDPSGRYVYYYAHLMRYADGIAEGQHLRRGDLIGYVGDTGNAGVGNYHLHFAISKVTAPHAWSGGEPINPYPLLGGK